MKTKLLCIALLPLLFFSCIKDYIGEGPKKIEFTKENYIYEGELYRVYLNAEIEALDIKIQDLKDILTDNAGDEEAKEELAAAFALRGELKDGVGSFVSLEQVGIRIPSPPPPCPIPNNCDFSGLEYILTSAQTAKLQVLFFNEKGNVVGGGIIDELSPLPGSEGQISFSRLMIGKYDSPVTKIRVETTSFDKTTRVYEL